MVAPQKKTSGPLQRRGRLPPPRTTITAYGYPMPLAFEDDEMEVEDRMDDCTLTLTATSLIADLLQEVVIEHVEEAMDVDGEEVEWSTCFPTLTAISEAEDEALPREAPDHSPLQAQLTFETLQAFEAESCLNSPSSSVAGALGECEHLNLEEVSELARDRPKRANGRILPGEEIDDLAETESASSELVSLDFLTSSMSVATGLPSPMCVWFSGCAPSAKAATTEYIVQDLAGLPTGTIADQLAKSTAASSARVRPSVPKGERGLLRPRPGRSSAVPGIAAASAAAAGAPASQARKARPPALQLQLLQAEEEPEEDSAGAPLPPAPDTPRAAARPSKGLRAPKLQLSLCSQPAGGIYSDVPVEPTTPCPATRPGGASLLDTVAAAVASMCPEGATAGPGKEEQGCVASTMALAPSPPLPGPAQVLPVKLDSAAVAVGRMTTKKKAAAVFRLTSASPAPSSGRGGERTTRRSSSLSAMCMDLGESVSAGPPASAQLRVGGGELFGSKKLPGFLPSIRNSNAEAIQWRVGLDHDFAGSRDDRLWATRPIF